MLKRVHQFHPRSALEHGLASKMYFTLPDYRYRSFDCLRLIDANNGTQCLACQKPKLEPSDVIQDEKPSQGGPPDPPDVLELPPIPPADESPPSEPLNLSLHCHEDQDSGSSRNFTTTIHAAGQQLLDDAEDDLRLAKDAGRCMTLRPRSHSCCPEWDPDDRCGSAGPRRTRSDSPLGSIDNSSGADADADFPPQWVVKQENNDSAHNNGS